MSLAKFFSDDVADSIYQRYVYKQLVDWYAATPHDWKVVRRARTFKHRQSDEYFNLTYFVMYSWQWAYNSMFVSEKAKQLGEEPKLDEHEFTIAFIPSKYDDILLDEIAKSMPGEEVVVVSLACELWACYYHKGLADEKTFGPFSLDNQFHSFSVFGFLIVQFKPAEEDDLESRRLCLDLSGFKELVALCNPAEEEGSDGNEDWVVKEASIIG